MTMQRTSRKQWIAARGILLVVAVWILLAFEPAAAQDRLTRAVDTWNRGPQEATGKPEPASPRIFREIADRPTGIKWLLVPDPAHPAGPGRLVQAELSGSFSARFIAGTANQGQRDDPPLPVIHMGDKVVVEEHRSAIEACLEAVALEPAAVGSAIDVRLKFSNKVVRAVAVGPGRTALNEVSR